MENYERKFIVDPEGNTEEVKLSEEEKRQKFAAMHSKPELYRGPKVVIEGKEWKWDPTKKKYVKEEEG